MTEIKNGSIKLIKKDHSTEAHININGRWYIFGIVDQENPEYIMTREEMDSVIGEKIGDDIKNGTLKFHRGYGPTGDFSISIMVDGDWKLLDYIESYGTGEDMIVVYDDKYTFRHRVPTTSKLFEFDTEITIDDIVKALWSHRRLLYFNHG